MPLDADLVRAIFEESLALFLANETQGILEGVNERSNCGRMAIYMEQVANARGLTGYFADTEYNRKQHGEIKTIVDDKLRVININCDLILHSRGQNLAEDNLIAVEVKKRDRPRTEKTKDRERLRALTKASYNDVWCNDGVTLPEHVCGYVLGVFVEIDRHSRSCRLEYFRHGERFEDAVRKF